MRKWIVLGLGLAILMTGGALRAQQTPQQQQAQKTPVEERQISRLPPLPQPLDPILQEMFAKRRA
jgi:hypothetical protein